MGEPRRLIETLTLPFKSAQTIYEGSSEVRLYVNDVTGVYEIGKRVHRLGLEDVIGFKEAALLQTIRHDHLVPVYTVASVSEPNSDPLFTAIEMIMPYYPRGSVFDVLVKRKERLRMSEAVRLTRDFLLGLDYLHEKHHLLHRDMKSANVFVDPAGRGRIGDLGISVPMEADGTAEAFQAGLQMYTAPETFPTKRADRRTDIYGVA